MRKVFLSSTFQDLAEHRQAICDAIEGLDGYYCVRMETFGARAQTAFEFCQAKVRECDLFIGVLGHLYGNCPPGNEKSFTEYEYEAASNIPRLMFIAPDTFYLPMNLRESDIKWQRQRAFREHVSQEQIRADFNSPQALVVEVIKAIRNWELGQLRSSDEEAATLPARWRHPGSSQARNPHLGSLVTKLCDRSTQEEEFSAFFSLHIRQHAGFPQIYLIRGEENERPDSLIERLGQTNVQDYANYKWGEQKAAVTHKSVDWPHDGDPTQRRQRVVSWLFKRFDPAYEFNHEDFSPASFVQLPALTLYPVVILQHDVRAARWDQAAKSLLEWYLRFWDSIARLHPKPQFLVFLNIIYPPKGEDGFWKVWLRTSRFDKKRVERDLVEIYRLRQSLLTQDAQSKACPCLLIEELSCVEREQVIDWFKRHKIYEDWKIWQAKCNEIFVSSDCRNMADIEYELKNIHQEFIATRGYL